MITCDTFINGECPLQTMFMRYINLLIKGSAVSDHFHLESLCLPVGKVQRVPEKHGR